ncbi:MAG: hypothetical protein ABH885_01290, partial [Candidatus Omnitrophota bacterium]
AGSIDISEDLQAAGMEKAPAAAAPGEAGADGAWSVPKPYAAIVTGATGIAAMLIGSSSYFAIGAGCALLIAGVGLYAMLLLRYRAHVFLSDKANELGLDLVKLGGGRAPQIVVSSADKRKNDLKELGQKVEHEYLRELERREMVILDNMARERIRRELGYAFRLDIVNTLSGGRLAVVNRRWDRGRGESVITLTITRTAATTNDSVMLKALLAHEMGEMMCRDSKRYPLLSLFAGSSPLISHAVAVIVELLVIGGIFSIADPALSGATKNERIDTLVRLADEDRLDAYQLAQYIADYDLYQEVQMNPVSDAIDIVARSDLDRDRFRFYLAQRLGQDYVPRKNVSDVLPPDDIARISEKARELNALVDARGPVLIQAGISLRDRDSVLAWLIRRVNDGLSELERYDGYTNAVLRKETQGVRGEMRFWEETYEEVKDQEIAAERDRIAGAQIGELEAQIREYQESDDDADISRTVVGRAVSRVVEYIRRANGPSDFVSAIFNNRYQKGITLYVSPGGEVLKVVDSAADQVSFDLSEELPAVYEVSIQGALARNGELVLQVMGFGGCPAAIEAFANLVALELKSEENLALMRRMAEERQLSKGVLWGVHDRLLLSERYTSMDIVKKIILALGKDVSPAGARLIHNYLLEDFMLPLLEELAIVALAWIVPFGSFGLVYAGLRAVFIGLHLITYPGNKNLTALQRAAVPGLISGLALIPFIICSSPVSAPLAFAIGLGAHIFGNILVDVLGYFGVKLGKGVLFADNIEFLVAALQVPGGDRADIRQYIRNMVDEIVRRNAESGKGRVSYDIVAKEVRQLFGALKQQLMADVNERLNFLSEDFQDWGVAKNGYIADPANLPDPFYFAPKGHEKLPWEKQREIPVFTIDNINAPGVRERMDNLSEGERRKVDYEFYMFRRTAQEKLRDAERSAGKAGRDFTVYDKVKFLVEYMRSQIDTSGLAIMYVRKMVNMVRKKELPQRMKIGSIIAVQPDDNPYGVPAGKRYAACRHMAGILKYMLNDAGIRATLKRGIVVREEDKHAWVGFEYGGDEWRVDPMWGDIYPASDLRLRRGRETVDFQLSLYNPDGIAGKAARPGDAGKWEDELRDMAQKRKRLQDYYEELVRDLDAFMVEIVDGLKESYLNSRPEENEMHRLLEATPEGQALREHGEIIMREMGLEAMPDYVQNAARLGLRLAADNSLDDLMRLLAQKRREEEEAMQDGRAQMDKTPSGAIRIAIKLKEKVGGAPAHAAREYKAPLIQDAGEKHLGANRPVIYRFEGDAAAEIEIAGTPFLFQRKDGRFVLSYLRYSQTRGSIYEMDVATMGESSGGITRENIIGRESHETDLRDDMERCWVGQIELKALVASGNLSARDYRQISRQHLAIVVNGDVVMFTHLSEHNTTVIRSASDRSDLKKRAIARRLSKGVLNFVARALNRVGISGTPNVENFLIPFIENSAKVLAGVAVGVLFGAVAGYAAYAVAELIFVMRHAFQNYAPYSAVRAKELLAGQEGIDPKDVVMIKGPVRIGGGSSGVFMVHVGLTRPALEKISRLKDLCESYGISGDAVSGIKGEYSQDFFLINDLYVPSDDEMRAIKRGDSDGAELAARSGFSQGRVRIHRGADTMPRIGEVIGREGSQGPYEIVLNERGDVTVMAAGQGLADRVNRFVVRYRGDVDFRGLTAAVIAKLYENDMRVREASGFRAGAAAGNVNGILGVEMSYFPILEPLERLSADQARAILGLEGEAAARELTKIIGTAKSHIDPDLRLTGEQSLMPEMTTYFSGPPDVAPRVNQLIHRLRGGFEYSDMLMRETAAEALKSFLGHVPNLATSDTILALLNVMADGDAITRRLSYDVLEYIAASTNFSEDVRDLAQKAVLSARRTLFEKIAVPFGIAVCGMLPFAFGPLFGLSSPAVIFMLSYIFGTTAHIVANVLVDALSLVFQKGVVGGEESEPDADAVGGIKGPDISNERRVATEQAQAIIDSFVRQDIGRYGETGRGAGSVTDPANAEPARRYRQYLENKYKDMLAQAVVLAEDHELGRLTAEYERLARVFAEVEGGVRTPLEVLEVAIEIKARASEMEQEVVMAEAGPIDKINILLGRYGSESAPEQRAEIASGIDELVNNVLLKDSVKGRVAYEHLRTSFSREKLESKPESVGLIFDDLYNIFASGIMKNAAEAETLRAVLDKLVLKPIGVDAAKSEAAMCAARLTQKGLRNKDEADDEKGVDFIVGMIEWNVDRLQHAGDPALFLKTVFTLFANLSAQSNILKKVFDTTSNHTLKPRFSRMVMDLLFMAQPQAGADASGVGLNGRMWRRLAQIADFSGVRQSARSMLAGKSFGKLSASSVINVCQYVIDESDVRYMIEFLGEPHPYEEKVTVMSNLGYIQAYSKHDIVNKVLDGNPGLRETLYAFGAHYAGNNPFVRSLLVLCATGAVSDLIVSEYDTQGSLGKQLAIDRLARAADDKSISFIIGKAASASSQEVMRKAVDALKSLAVSGRLEKYFEDHTEVAGDLLGQFKVFMLLHGPLGVTKNMIDICRIMPGDTGTSFIVEIVTDTRVVYDGVDTGYRDALQYQALTALADMAQKGALGLYIDANPDKKAALLDIVEEKIYNSSLDVVPIEESAVKVYSALEPGRFAEKFMDNIFRLVEMFSRVKDGRDVGIIRKRIGLLLKYADNDLIRACIIHDYKIKPEAQPFVGFLKERAVFVPEFADMLAQIDPGDVVDIYAERITAQCELLRNAGGAGSGSNVNVLSDMLERITAMGGAVRRTMLLRPSWSSVTGVVERAVVGIVENYALTAGQEDDINRLLSAFRDYLYFVYGTETAGWTSPNISEAREDAEDAFVRSRMEIADLTVKVKGYIISNADASYDDIMGRFSADYEKLSPVARANMKEAVLRYFRENRKVKELMRLAGHAGIIEGKLITKSSILNIPDPEKRKEVSDFLMNVLNIGFIPDAFKLVSLQDTVCVVMDYRSYGRFMIRIRGGGPDIDDKDIEQFKAHYGVYLREHNVNMQQGQFAGLLLVQNAVEGYDNVENRVHEWQHRQFNAFFTGEVEARQAAQGARARTMAAVLNNDTYYDSALYDQLTDVCLGDYVLPMFQDEMQA